MIRSATAILLAGLVGASASAARADELSAFLSPPAAAAAATKKSAPADDGPSRWLQGSLGVEAGGAPLLRQPDGPVAETTAHTAVSIFARLTMPILSSRIVEVSVVPHHGAGLMLESGDLHLGGAKLHLLDLGLFYDWSAPIEVARVARRWDVALGAGLEIPIGRRLCVVADARLFAPVDLWSVVTRYGDTARLIGDEILHGAQLWAGAAYRF